jgi:alkaline phosphatase D
MLPVAEGMVDFDLPEDCKARNAAIDQLTALMTEAESRLGIAAPAPKATAVRPLTGGRVKTLSEFRARYALHKSDPDLQAAHAAAPWLVIWDDHEVENDYAGWQGEFLQADFAQQRAAAYQAYWEHMPLPKASRPVNGDMRMHGRLDWGALARIHLLDDRQYRDVQVCPRPGRGGSNNVGASCVERLDPALTMLGAAQERWLDEGFASSTARWNVVAQQTLMARLARSSGARRGSGPMAGTDIPPRGRGCWTRSWRAAPPTRSSSAATSMPGTRPTSGATSTTRAARSWRARCAAARSPRRGRRMRALPRSRRSTRTCASPTGRRAATRWRRWRAAAPRSRCGSWRR